MKKTRRNYSAAFKATVALAADGSVRDRWRQPCDDGAAAHGRRPRRLGGGSLDHGFDAKGNERTGSTSTGRVAEFDLARPGGAPRQRVDRGRRDVRAEVYRIKTVLQRMPIRLPQVGRGSLDSGTHALPRTEPGRSEPLPVLRFSAHCRMRPSARTRPEGQPVATG
jgi:hypothetical protein